jgi:NodT family efflux transporter outer membrane factor (OMF) lipoprotein
MYGTQTSLLGANLSIRLPQWRFIHQIANLKTAVLRWLSPGSKELIKWVSVLGVIGTTSLTPQLSAAEQLPNAASVIQQKRIQEIENWKALPSATESQNINQCCFPKADWWNAFQDPSLNVLIEQGLDNNPQLKAMKWQVASATATSKLARANLLPKAAISPNYTWEQLGLHQYFFPIQSRIFQVYQIPLAASYEVDLWGKNWASYQSAKKGIKIAQVQYEAGRIELSSAIATAYFNIAKWRQLEALAQEELDLSQKLLSHSQGLLDLGQATTFDIQNSQQRRDLAQVNVTQYGNNRELAENQLINLLGEIPSHKPVITVSNLAALEYPKTLETGVPSLLVVHRPDIVISELQLAAAKLDVQAARKAMLPSLTLNGSTGPFAVGANHLFKWTSMSSFATALLSQPIYQGGRLRAQVHLQKANYQQVLHRYEDVINTAFTEAENSLATFKTNRIAYQEIMSQTENARNKAHHYEELYKAGVEGEPLWVAEEVQRIEYEKQLTQQKTQVLIDTVSVAKALGGGFSK